MFTLRDILLGVALPAAVALAVCVALSLVRREWAGRLAAGLGVAGGLATAYLAVPGQLDLGRFPPADTTHWIFFGLLPLAALAALDSLVRLRPAVRIGAVALVAAALLALVLLRTIQNRWGPAEAAGRLAGLTLVSALAWAAADSATARLPGWLGAAALAALAGGVSVVLMLSATIRLGQAALYLAAVAGAVAAAGLVLRQLTPHRGGAAVIIVTLMALLSAGRFYADLHLADAALLAAAPILMWVGSLMPARWPKLRSVAAVALMVAGIAAAVALAAGRYLAEQSADPYGGYY